MHVNQQELARGADGSSILSTPNGLVAVSPDGIPTLMPANFANQVLTMINAAGEVDPASAAEIANAARQFDAGFQLDIANRNANAVQQAQQFNTSNQLTADQANAANALRAAEANLNARLRVEETNASLRARQAELAEQIRQADIQDARERENMRFLLRKEQVATEEGNRAAFQNAVALREQIAARIETNRFQRQSLVTEVNSLNTQMENNVRQFNAQEAARVEQLNEQRRQANLDRLQSVSTQIGELAQNPADVGKLAAFLRSGRPDAISSAIARGENAITDESLLGLRGLLGVREGLQQGPTLATGNFIEADLVDVPQFDTPLGEAPDVNDLFQQIQFDPEGIERGASPAAGDLGQYFQEIGMPPEIAAQLVNSPPEVQAQVLGSPQFADAVAANPPPAQSAGSLPVTVGPAPTQDEITSLPVGGQIQTPSGQVFTNRGAPNGALSALDDDEFGKVPNFVRKDFGLPLKKEEQQAPPTRESLTDEGVHVGASVSDEQIEEFFQGFGRGGVASPGTPVIVGDSSDGKENQELAMVDAFGNLVVTPLDDLPRAEEGGVFGLAQQARTHAAPRSPRRRRRRGGRRRRGPGQGFPTFGDEVRPGRRSSDAGRRGVADDDQGRPIADRFRSTVSPRNLRRDSRRSRVAGGLPSISAGRKGFDPSRFGTGPGQINLNLGFDDQPLDTGGLDHNELVRAQTSPPQIPVPAGRARVFGAATGPAMAQRRTSDFDARRSGISSPGSDRVTPQLLEHLRVAASRESAVERRGGATTTQGLAQRRYREALEGLGIPFTQFPGELPSPYGDRYEAIRAQGTGARVNAPFAPPAGALLPQSPAAAPTTFAVPQAAPMVGGAPPPVDVPQAEPSASVAPAQPMPVDAEVARLFQQQVAQDAMRRAGFTDPSQASPIKVSAPGTRRFLQDLSASVAGTLGFGPSQLFFEELQRLQPQGVRSGVARRTG